MSSSSSSDSFTSRDFLRKGSQLVFFLVLLPVFLTTCHLFYTFQGQGIVLVEILPASTRDTLSASSLESINGIYWSQSPQPQLSQYQQQQQVPTFLRQQDQHSLFGILPSWPSISQLATSIIRHGPPSFNAKTTKLEYIQMQQSYCFTLGQQETLCPVREDGGESNAEFIPPSISRWKIIPENGKTMIDPSIITLRITSFQWFKPYYFQKEEKPFQQLVQCPATCLLLAVNIGLAFLYWNYRISPNGVALMDGPMMGQEYQYWRAFSGSLAHFEWWHLLFNMMSLHNLGQFLELSYYGSIPFLFYNLSLIPLTVLIFLGGTQLVYYIRVRQARINGNTTFVITRQPINAVGYSGVLFAWMVVSSLEQPKSCPIPFLKDVCFDTWHLTKHLKFNVGPLIQLVIAQVILPRVSLGGHLAGVVAGFLLHWQLLPLEFVQPSVLIPILTLVQWKHRNCIPMLHNSSSSSSGQFLTGPRNFLDVAGIDDDDNNNNNQHVNGSPGVKDDSGALANTSTPFACRHPCDKSIVPGLPQLILTLLYSMGLLLLGSILLLRWSSGLLLSQIILLVLFYICYPAYTDHWDDEGEQDNWSPEASQKKQRMLILWKGFITSCILVLILESMTLASWTLMGSAMFSRAASLWALLLLGSHIAIHVLALCVASKHWEDIGGEKEEKGIFEYLFGRCVLENAKVVGQKVLTAWISSAGCQRGLRGAFFSAPRKTTSPTQVASTSMPSPGRRQGADREQAKRMAAAAAERRANAAMVSDVV